MGIIERSTPSVNSPIPPISMIVPTTNAISVPEGNGATNILRIRTIAATGTTDASASLIFTFRLRTTWIIRFILSDYSLLLLYNPAS